MAFHWKNGWFFIRTSEDGDVEIRHYSVEEQQKSPGPDIQGFPGYPAIPTVLLPIPSCEWASIIASVSAKDETSEQYEVALRFHNENT